MSGKCALNTTFYVLHVININLFIEIILNKIVAGTGKPCTLFILLLAHLPIFHGSMGLRLRAIAFMSSKDKEIRRETNCEML